MYVFAFVYDGKHRAIDRGYYELTWGSGKPQTIEAEKSIVQEIKAEADSIAKDSNYVSIGEKLQQVTSDIKK